MHLVGFIIKIYHDKLSPECQINILGIVIFQAEGGGLYWLGITYKNVQQQC